MVVLCIRCRSYNRQAALHRPPFDPKIEDTRLTGSILKIGVIEINAGSMMPMTALPRGTGPVRRRATAQQAGAGDRDTDVEALLARLAAST